MAEPNKFWVISGASDAVGGKQIEKTCFLRSGLQSGIQGGIQLHDDTPNDPPFGFICEHDLQQVFWEWHTFN